MKKLGIYILLTVVVISALFLIFKYWGKTDMATYTNSQYGLIIGFSKEVQQIYTRTYNLDHANIYNPSIEIDFDKENRGTVAYDSSSNHFGDVVTLYVYDLKQCATTSDKFSVDWCSTFANGQSGFSHFGNEAGKNGFVGYWVHKGDNLFAFDISTIPNLKPEDVPNMFSISFK